jgi:hypothetical protein
MSPALRSITAAAAVTGMVLLAASPAREKQGRHSQPLDNQTLKTRVLVPHGVEGVSRQTAPIPRNESVSDGEELAIDDGSSDGRGLLEDGLTLAVRLTPAAYPVRLTAIRISFPKFNGATDPAGKTVRLIAFAGSGPEPAAGVTYLVDREVPIPRTGAFVDFAIPDGPVIRSGDLWVGYQAPKPATGVGFATDTSGVQSDRTYWLEYGATSWGGPLSFTDETKANGMIRAKVATTLPDSGEFELRTDDGTIEGGLLRDGAIYLNRLTPPKYPATLSKIRIYVPLMEDQPSPEGKTVNVIAFRDATGAGVPPDGASFDVNKPVKLGKTGDFTEIALDAPAITAGDIYVGFQAPDPHDGVAFAVDTDGQPFQRMFRSRDGGKTYTGPIELVGDSSQGTPVNLMVRAVVRLGAPVELKPNYTLETSAAEIDLSEGGSETVELTVKGPDSTTNYSLRAKFDPDAPALSAQLGQAETRSQEKVAVKITSSGPSELTSAPLVLEASDGKTTARITVPVYLWRELASAAIGPKGGRVDAPAVSVVIPDKAFAEERTIRVLTGKPVTGREDSIAGPIYRVDGLPANYREGLQIRMPVAAPKAGAANAARSADAADGQVGVLQFTLPDATGKTVPAQVFQPAKIENGTIVLDCPAKKATVTNRFSFWMLSGWYTLESEGGNFYVFYPIGARDAAVWAAAQLEKALANLASADVNVPVLDRISYVSTLGNVGFTTHPIRATLDSTLTANGRSQAGQIYLDLKVMKDEAGRTNLRSTPGHELMHIAQNLYGSGQGSADWWLGRADPTVWGDDALATWFEPLAVSEPSFVPDNMEAGARDFCMAGPLSVPGTYAGDRDYGYGAANFITYLSRFVDKTIPSRWLEQRTADRSAWALLLPLMGGSSALAGHWRDFGEKLLTQKLLPNSSYPNPVNFMPLNDTGRFEFMKPNEREDKKWAQAHDLSMYFYSFLMPNGVPTLTDNTVLGFQVLEKYPDADLYVLGLKGLKFISMQRGVGELTIDAKDIKDEPGLLVGVVNYSYDESPSVRSRRDLTVRMGLADPTVKIPGSVGDRVIGATYTFTTQNRNIPADATYTWNFGDKTGTGRTATTSWKNAGTYKVRVEVKWSTTTVSDEISVTVAPDKPAPQKAEVLFDVYRRVKNSMGTSNQRCNDYSISISDPTGVVVDGGSSVARNGAYDTTLPVGNGYGYRIRYAYTIPCPDSGTASGKFDVKANTITGVMVETPPCEQ